MAPPAPCRSSPLPRLPEATKQTHPSAGPPRPRSGPSGRRQTAPPRRPAANGDAAASRSPPPLTLGAPAAALDRRRLEAPPGVSQSGAGGHPRGEKPGGRRHQHRPGQARSGRR
nr:translation initiation factor IF-2-like [Aegilops tauschii subsp. strangulata]